MPPYSVVTPVLPSPTPYTAASCVAVGGGGRCIVNPGGSTNRFMSRITVKVMSADGSPANGEIVTATPMGAGPTLYFQSSNTATVDAQGYAKFEWAYPNSVTGQHEVHVSPNSNPSLVAVFYFTNQAAATPISLGGVDILLSRIAMSAPQGAAFPYGLYSSITDNTGNNLSGYSMRAEMVSAPTGAHFAENGSTILDGLTAGGAWQTQPPVAGSGVGTFEVLVYRADLGTGQWIPHGVVTLTVANENVAFSIATDSGSGQSVDAGLSFATPLVAKVTNKVGTGLAGETVTFTAPASGASCTLGGAATQVVLTDAQGLAHSVTPVANSTVGSYVVAATVAGVANPANFTLANAQPAPPTDLFDPLLYCEV